MGHTIEQAKVMLARIEAIKQLKGKDRVAESVLIIAEIQVVLAALIECALLLESRDVLIIGKRRELRDSIRQLRAEVWRINGEVAKVMNWTGSDIHVPVAPISKTLIRCISVMDEIEEIIDKEENCG